MDALQASIVLGDSLRFVSQRDYYIFLLRGGKRALILSHVISLVISRMQYTVEVWEGRKQTCYRTIGVEPFILWAQEHIFNSWLTPAPLLHSLPALRTFILCLPKEQTLLFACKIINFCSTQFIACLHPVASFTETTPWVNGAACLGRAASASLLRLEHGHPCLCCVLTKPLQRCQQLSCSLPKALSSACCLRWGWLLVRLTYKWKCAAGADDGVLSKSTPCAKLFIHVVSNKLTPWDSI